MWQRLKETEILNNWLSKVRPKKKEPWRSYVIKTWQFVISLVMNMAFLSEFKSVKHSLPVL